jgi:hypothetical protein
MFDGCTVQRYYLTLPVSSFDFFFKFDVFWPYRSVLVFLIRNVFTYHG